MINISDLIKNLFLTDPNKSVLGIDVGPSSIKIVQLKKKKGRAILETYGELSLGPYGGIEIGRATNLPTDKIGQAVVDVLRESNATTNKCGISIPMGSSLVSFIKLPRVEEKQLAQMIPLEARKYIPVPISEVTLDYLIIPKNESAVSEYQNNSEEKPEDKTVDVLLVVIHNDALEKNREITRLAKLDTAFSEIEIFGSMRSVLESGTAPQMIIDFGSNSTKVYIVERGILRTSHLVSRGSQDITLAISKSLGVSVEEAEKIKRERGLLGKEEHHDVNEVTSLTLDYIFSEIGRVLLNYQKNNGKNVSKIFLTGGGVLLKGLREKAESSFSVPVVTADPFSKVEYPAFLEAVLKQAGPSFSVAIGLALRRLQDIN